MAKRARGQIAQDRIVSCIEAAVNLPIDEFERERELFVNWSPRPNLQQCDTSSFQRGRLQK